MASGEPLLRMEQIDKRFPGVHALDHVTFSLDEGEVHVLLGENGAGKSTLVKILSGSLPKDSGHIFIRGQEVKHLNPERAQALGIGMVYQELSLVPVLTVAENIFLGQLPRSRMGLVNWSQIYAKTRESFAVLGVDINPRAQVRELSVAEQQLTEIARVLNRQTRILVLDEPTSALSDTERERLFDLIRRLQARGVGIVYISHHLEEVPLIGQRVTVMRDGQVVETSPVHQTDKDSLITLMVGRQLTDQYPKTVVEAGEPMLRVENLSLTNRLHNLSFEVRRGEILGIFGIMGAGQTELADVLFGLRSRSSGRVSIEDREVRIHRPVEAIEHGIGYLLRDRRSSLVPVQPIPPNITLAEVSRFALLRFLNLKREAAAATGYVRELSIRPPLLNRAVMYLSGGNQQKVCLARWLFSQAKVLIVDEPTRGIDVGAKAEVFALIDRLAQQGVAIIMISSEIPEILAMADRTLVMKSGRFAAEFMRGEATPELLLKNAS